MNITEIKIEYRKNPLGLDVKKPRFSWVIQSEEQEVVQSARISQY